MLRIASLSKANTVTIFKPNIFGLLTLVSALCRQGKFLRITNHSILVRHCDTECHFTVFQFFTCMNGSGITDAFTRKNFLHHHGRRNAEMLHLPHRFYHRNYIINRISPFIHNLKDYLAIFSRINHMTAIIIYKTDLAQLQLRNRLLHLRLFLILLHTHFPYFRNIRILLYLLFASAPSTRFQ